MVLSITFVRESAIWAPDGTHRILIPFWRCSLMSFACSIVLNSVHAGGAVRLIRSYNDLQSVVIMACCSEGNCLINSSTDSGIGTWGSSSGCKAENAGGSWRSVSSACFHLHRWSMTQAHISRIQDKTSTAPAKAMASADNVLTTTFCIFLECHIIGLITLWALSPIFLWAAIMIIPWWELGFFSDAKEASEKATYRRSLRLIGCMCMAVDACCLASWSVLLASMRVETLAVLIRLCNHPRREHKSGRVFTAAYCKLPISARSSCRSCSETTSSDWERRSREREWLQRCPSHTVFGWLRCCNLVSVGSSGLWTWIQSFSLIRTDISAPTGSASVETIVIHNIIHHPHGYPRFLWWHAWTDQEG